MIDKSLLTLLKLDDFVVIDFETTGFSSERDHLIEVAAVRFTDGEPVADFQQLIDPGVPIPREIVDLTHISDEMVAGQPTIEDIGQDFIDFIGDSPLVAQNISFDLSFLKVIHQKITGKNEVNAELYDTLPLARTFLFHRAGYSLVALCEYFDIGHDNAHRAYHDALNTGHIFLQLIEEAGSYPLPLLQSMLGVQAHIDNPNKWLYSRLVDALSSSGRVKGYTESQIDVTLSHAILKDEGAGENFEPQTAEQFFDSDGILGKEWHDYEPRPVQTRFSSAVTSAFGDGEILLAEAGTGLGKSMAYLLPAITLSVTDSIPVVIASHTKHLQDQLFQQELPRVAKLLNAPVRAVVLKGRTNYLCRTRLQFVIDNASRLLSPDDCEKILPIILWEQFTLTGDIEECSGFSVGQNSKLWHILRSEKGYCLGHICQRFNGCFVGPLRRAVREASIIIINQALLLADAAGDGGLLPPEFRLVLDEAHNLPKVTTEQLTTDFSADVVRELTENYQSGRHRRIFRSQLQDALRMVDEEGDLWGSIVEKARTIRESASQLIDTYLADRHLLSPADGRQNYQQGRYTEPSVEFRGLETHVEEMDDSLKSFTKTLRKIHKLIDNTDMPFPESLSSDIESDLDEASALRTSFQRIAVEEPDGSHVLWREIRGSGGRVYIKFRAAPLWVDEFLRTRLFERRPGTVLCSATLQTDGSFDYFRREVGLGSDFSEYEVVEKEFASPFMYEEQCAAFFWDTSTDVNDEHYPLELANLIDDLTDRVHRRVLVLFTSYAALRAVHEVLRSRLMRSDRELLTQFARSSRKGLLDSFKRNPRSILLGTSSFWEGVDLPGDLLEVVVMARLPFGNPSDPVMQARIEYLRDTGMNPFMDYQIPDAITRFRQGFGRLIRTTYDEGIFIIADSRVARKRYGENFLDALPLTALPFNEADTIVAEAKGKVFQHIN